jgi:hypothetical protein
MEGPENTGIDSEERTIDHNRLLIGQQPSTILAYLRSGVGSDLRVEFEGEECSLFLSDRGDVVFRDDRGNIRLADGWFLHLTKESVQNLHVMEKARYKAENRLSAAAQSISIADLGMSQGDLGFCSKRRAWADFFLQLYSTGIIADSIREAERVVLEGWKADYNNPGAGSVSQRAKSSDKDDYPSGPVLKPRRERPSSPSTSEIVEEILDRLKPPRKNKKNYTVSHIECQIDVYFEIRTQDLSEGFLNGLPPNISLALTGKGDSQLFPLDERVGLRLFSNYNVLEYPDLKSYFDGYYNTDGWDINPKNIIVKGNEIIVIYRVVWK